MRLLILLFLLLTALLPYKPKPGLGCFDPAATSYCMDDFAPCAIR